MGATEGPRGCTEPMKDCGCLSGMVSFAKPPLHRPPSPRTRCAILPRPTKIAGPESKEPPAESVSTEKPSLRFQRPQIPSCIHISLWTHCCAIVFGLLFYKLKLLDFNIPGPGPGWKKALDPTRRTKREKHPGDLNLRIPSTL